MDAITIPVWTKMGRSGAYTFEEVDIFNVPQEKIHSAGVGFKGILSRRERAHRRSVRAKAKLSRKKNRQK